MDIGQHFFPNLSLCGRFRRKRIAHTLIAARDFQTTFDTDFIHQPRRIKPSANHTDTADHAGRVRINLVSRRRNVITARCTHIFRHHIHRNVFMLRFHTADFVKRNIGNHRRSARTIGADDNRFSIGIIVNRLHTGAQHLNLIIKFIADFTFQIYHCRMFPTALHCIGIVSKQ